MFPMEIVNMICFGSLANMTRKRERASQANQWLKEPAISRSARTCHEAAAAAHGFVSVKFTRPGFFARPTNPHPSEGSIPSFNGDLRFAPRNRELSEIIASKFWRTPWPKSNIISGLTRLQDRQTSPKYNGAKNFNTRRKGNHLT